MNTMKTTTILAISLASLLLTTASAQTINWAHLQPEEKHLVSVQAGFEYAFAYGLGYARKLGTKMPSLLMVEVSQPAGEDLFDDFKTKIGGQVRVLQLNRFQVSLKVQGVFRRYQNDYVRMLNFGSDMSASAGYYRPRWFAAGETGFDKAIVTHFKHSDLVRADFPGVRDGWYKPATGGNFYYGISAGLSLPKTDITIRAGRVIQQDFRTNPTIPFYCAIGVTRKF